MRVDKVYSVDAKLTVYKERQVDVLVYAHPRILNLLDVQVNLQLPVVNELDVIITPFRQVEHTQDPFETHKEDAPSFFEAYESDNNAIVNSNLLSPNLKAIEPLSKRLRKPVGRFHTLHTISEQYSMVSDDDRYVALLPKDYQLLLNMNDYLENFWFTVVSNPDKIDHFIDYSKSTNPHEEAFRQFKFDYDHVELYQEHIVDCSTVPNVGETDQRILVSYSALLYIPYLRHYQVSISAGDSNTGDEVVEVYIDDENVVSSYKYNGSSQISKELTLSEGFHTITVVKIIRVGSYSHKTVQLEQGSTTLDLSVSSLSSVGIEVYSPSFLFKVDSLERFVFYPFSYFNNELSILNKKYMPVTILSVPDKEQIFRSYRNRYIFNPHQIDTVACNFSYSNAFNTVTYSNPAVITKSDEHKPAILLFKYNNAVMLNAITIYDNSMPIDKRFKTIKFRLFDKVGNYVNPNDLVNQFDNKSSFNVATVRAENGWFVVSRENTKLPIQVVMKHAQLSLGFDVSIPIKTEYKIDQLIVGAVNYANFSVATQSAKFYEIEQLDYNRLKEVTTRFDRITAIPEVFRHELLPGDIKNSSGYIIFGLKDYSPLNIEVLGTAFDIWNKDKVKHTEYRYLAIHNLWGDRFKFNVYNNWDKSQLYDWNHIVYDTNNNKIKADNLDSLSITLKNLTDSDLNGVFVIKVPHYDHAWKASVSGASVPIVGLNLDESGKPTQYVSSFDSWNTYYVAVQTSIAANDTTTVLLETGDFSNTSDITGSQVNTTAYTYEYDKTDTSIIVTDAGEWPPNSFRTIYVLNDDTPTKSTTIQADRSVLPLYTYDVINMKGEPVQSEFLLDMSAFRKMYGYHVPFRLVDATTYEPIDFLYRNAVNNYTKYFSQWTGDSIAVRWNSPPNLMQSILKKYADEGFDKYLDLTIDGWDYEAEKDQILFIRYGGKSGHPSNHNGLINDYNYTDLKYKGLRQDIDTGNYGDHYNMFFCTWLYVHEDGVWQFAVDGDDAVEVEIDGHVVASWYGAHGTCNCQSYNGSITLNKGLHKLIYRHEEEGGGDWARLWFKSPSMSSWQKFTVTNLQGKATCYASEPTDDEVKTIDFIKNGLGKPITKTIKLHLDDTVIDFLALNANQNNIRVLSDLLSELDYKVVNVDVSNQTLDLLVLPKDKFLYTDANRLYIVYGGYATTPYNDTLEEPTDITSYTVDGSGNLKPDDVDHRHEGTRLLVVPGQYTTQQEDTYTLPYVDSLQSPAFWYPCTPAKVDYSNSQLPITFLNEDDISFVPDKEGREGDAIELFGDSGFVVPLLSLSGDWRSISFHFFTVRKNAQLLFLSTISPTNDTDELKSNVIFSLFVNNEGKLQLNVGDDTMISDLTVSDGLWHHVVLNHRDGQLYLFVDGVSDSLPVSLSDSELVSIGTDSWSTGHYPNHANIWHTFENNKADFASVHVHGHTESCCDHAYVYDGEDNLICECSGTIDKTVTVQGSIVKARLTSDSSVTSSGVTFDVTWHVKVISFVFGQAFDANSMRGRFDEIRLYNRALSLPEIITLRDNLKVEFIPPDVKLIPTIPSNIDYPSAVTTSLIDLKSTTGEPVILHKYRNVPTVVVELLSNIFTV